MEYMKAYEHDIMMQERGEARGRRKEETSVVRKLSKSMSAEKIAELLELDVQYVQQMIAFLEENPEESDEQIALRMIADHPDQEGTEEK